MPPCRAGSAWTDPFSSLTSGVSWAGGAKDGGEDLSPDRLEKLHVRNAKQQPQHSLILVEVSWESGKSESHRQGCPGEGRELGLSPKPHFQFGARKIPQHPHL